MPDSNRIQKRLRVTSVIASLTAGGIGPVCRYAAEGIAKLTDWQVTLLSLHDPAGEFTDEASGLRVVCLGADENCARLFLDWLAAYPQQIVITNNVEHIESAFPNFPRQTLHVVQIHDSLRRYRDVAVRNHQWVDGVVCVAQHMESRLQVALERLRFHGLIATIHNGAAFPPMPSRVAHKGPLRLLYMGGLDPLIKGVFDLVSILERTTREHVPLKLTIAGGRNTALQARFKKRRLDHLVTWLGKIPHEECYTLASQCDVFLMTSRRESFGMVTIEAMSMGCVPIAYDIQSGSREIIEHGNSGLLLPLGDFAAWARALKSLFENQYQRQHLSEGAMHRARTQFNVLTMASRLRAFLERVQDNARAYPSERSRGQPAEFPPGTASQKSKYQRLSPTIRAWVRNQIGICPRLSYWLLKY